MRRPYGCAPATAARAAILALVLPVAGCASALERASANVPRTATPVVIDETIKALEDQATRERLAKVIATPEVQQAIRELANAAIPGVLDGVTDEESKARIEAFTKDIVSVIARVVMATIRPAVHEAMSEALSSEVRTTLDELVRNVAASAAHSAMRAAADDFPTTISPAMRTALAEGLASPEVRTAAAGTAHDLARSAVLGSREAVMEIQDAQTGRGPVQRVALFLVKAGWALLLFTTLFVGLIVTGMLSLRRRATRAEAASEASARHVRKLATLMLRAGNGGWSEADRESVEAALEEEEEPPSPRPRRRRRPRV
ncbi:hypothetical protein [Labilithrix luteola]|nr:hypothetical protein [Labilithrix luteola]